MVNSLRALGLRDVDDSAHSTCVSSGVRRSALPLDLFFPVKTVRFVSRQSRLFLTFLFAAGYLSDTRVLSIPVLLFSSFFVRDGSRLLELCSFSLPGRPPGSFPPSCVLLRLPGVGSSVRVYFLSLFPGDFSSF